ncbi:Crotonobetainyl-CoA:carnitine CoA-transferase CaiB [Colwellia chukchiensis]|uniref:Crotonobetainyl-CoA:carnitine CoA-transferase CaiB n=1 Tax=Colwellia chukchiensis TaxID=641665 RepID=A0A1H7K6P3_9GAMM|nr:CoA transferase [Colwellia chukchiensis]SEK81607.1 Crotonobetainyl-CoA:carnitine CoA-transferase CaiB [Colwellia chukchiensis]
MKLEGIKVLDLSLFLPGPHFTMMMADHGAEVISLEPPGGEPVRHVGLKQQGESVWFRNVFRGKKSINLNLKSAEGKAAFFKLCQSVDVMVEAFRPGVVDRLGIGYEDVKAVNPGIIYCAISAYGQTGPKRLSPAHDLSIQADSGAVSINEGPDGQPAQPAMPVADMAGSLMAFSGVLMAIIRKQQTGLGDYIDISMQDSLVAWYANVMGPSFAEQRSPVPKEERSWGGAAMYNIYKTADSQYLTLGGSELKFAYNLLTALCDDDAQRNELYECCKLPPGAKQSKVKDFFREKFISKSLAQWTEILANVDVCWAPVRDLHAAMQEAHLQQREMLLTDEKGNSHLGVPIKYKNEPAAPTFTLPKFSEHTKSTLLSIGYSENEIEEMLIKKAFLTE